MKESKSDMQRTLPFAFLLFLLFVLLMAGCKSSTDEKFISEGVIEYDAVAVDQSNPQAGMAPSKMSVKFKNDKVVVKMSAGLGVVGISIISDPEEKKYTEMVKIFSDKNAHISDSNEVKKLNDSLLSKMKIEYTEDTKVIAGYKCKKAVISFAGSTAKSPTNEYFTKPSFSVYYTNDINIKHSNWATEYFPIDGVLMEYQLDRYGLEMKFTASKVIKSEVTDSDFELPADYKLITKDQFEEIFKALQ